MRIFKALYEVADYSQWVILIAEDFKLAAQVLIEYEKAWPGSLHTEKGYTITEIGTANADQIEGVLAIDSEGV